MEDTCFDSLFKYFYNPINIKAVESDFLIGGKALSGEFRDYSMELASRFIGECNRNLETYRESPEYIRQELSNIKDKFCHVYHEEFGYEFANNQTIDLDTIVHSDTPHAKELRQAFKEKLSIYKLVFNNLEKLLSKNQPKEKASQNKRIRTKATRYAFVLKLSEDQFREIHEQLVRNGLIHETSNITDFINAFSGKHLKNKIIWKGGYYRLSLFIRELNTRDCFQNKVHDGLWEIVCDLFIPDQNPFFRVQGLLHASASKGVDYKRIHSIVDDIVDYTTPEYED